MTKTNMEHLTNEEIRTRLEGAFPEFTVDQLGLRSTNEGRQIIDMVLVETPDEEEDEEEAEADGEEGEA